MMGQIVYVDHFGNLISNLTRLQLTEVRSITKRSQPCIHFAGITIDGLVESYGDGAPNSPSALINSNGQLEVFVKEGNAAATLRAREGAPIEMA